MPSSNNDFAEANEWLKQNMLAGLIIAGIVTLATSVVTNHYLLDNSKSVVVPANINTSHKSDASTETKKVEQPKLKEWGEGTYEVGKDIPAGVYVANGTNCYWKISRDSNGSDIIENNSGSGQQIVTLQAGTFFKVGDCPFTART